MKLRLNVSVRTLEVLTGIDSVTASRCINRSLAFLGAIQFKTPSKGKVLVVDTTSTRVASTQDSHYSGHKHHKCVKVQVIVNTAGAVLHVSKPYPESAHDKTIWNKESAGIPDLMEHLILADKAYAGAKGEGKVPDLYSGTLSEYSSCAYDMECPVCEGNGKVVKK